MHEFRTGTRVVGKLERTDRNTYRCHSRVLKNGPNFQGQNNRYNPSGLCRQRTDQRYVGYS